MEVIQPNIVDTLKCFYIVMASNSQHIFLYPGTFAETWMFLMTEEIAVDYWLAEDLTGLVSLHSLDYGRMESVDGGEIGGLQDDIMGNISTPQINRKNYEYIYRVINPVLVIEEKLTGRGRFQCWSRPFLCCQIAMT